MDQPSPTVMLFDTCHMLKTKRDTKLLKKKISEDEFGGAIQTEKDFYLYPEK